MRSRLEYNELNNYIFDFLKSFCVTRNVSDDIEPRELNESDNRFNLTTKSYI